MSDLSGIPVRRRVYIHDADTLEAVGQGPRATYVVANWLRDRHREYRHIKTSQVLYRLKKMEKQGKVTRATGSRNPYAKMIMWEPVK